MNYGSWGLILVRELSRRLALVKLVSFLKAGLSSTDSYEDRFDRAFASLILDGDVIWDVGANIGLYTKKFSWYVGSSGKVYAFEPIPASFRELKRGTENLTNVVAINCAISNETGAAVMTNSSRGCDDDTAPTFSLLQDLPEGQNSKISVDIVTPKDLIARDAEAPRLVKIDVEGFEPEVLEGLMPLLETRQIRAIGMEIHFWMLSRRGKMMWPNSLIKQMIKLGYQYTWVDPSHVIFVEISE